MLRPLSALRLPVLGLVVLVLVVSCFQGARAPQVAAQRTLGMEGELGERASTKPFGVVFGGPRGATRDVSEVTVVFNRPMRALSLAGEESAPPASLQPQPKGSWRWLGTSALSFFPDPALPRATAYKVTVPSGTRALDGSALAKDYSFDFSTPRPKIVRTQPGEGDAQLTPRTTFELWLNQPVTLVEVERGIKLLAHEGKTPRAIAFSASFPKPDAPTRVVLKPRQLLPLDTRIELVADGLRGAEGPLPAERHAVSMHTYGPLAVGELGCSKGTPNKQCAARGGFWVSMSSRVSEKDFRAHLRVDGARLLWPKKESSSERDDRSSYFSLPIRVKPAQSFTVTVTAGLKDEHGQALARDRTFTLRTDDEWPEVSIGLRGSIFEAARSGGRDVPIAAVNSSEYELLSLPMSEDDVVRLSAPISDAQRFDYAARRPRAKRETERPQGAKNEYVNRTVALDQVLSGSKGRGAALFATRFNNGRRTETQLHMVQVTDLAVSAKLSRFGSIAWVTRLSDGKAVAGATVAVRDKEGREIFSGTTDKDGLCPIPKERWEPSLQEGSGDPREILFVRHAGDWAYRSIGDILSPWKFGPPSDVRGGLEPHGMLFTERGIYKVGETIHVKGLFREPLPRGTATPRGKTVAFQAHDREGTQLLEKKITLGPFGEFTVDVPVPVGGRLGTVDLRAELEGSGGTGRAYTQVDVAAYRPAEFTAAVEPERPSYIRGDQASFTTRGDYLFGAPMTAGRVRTTVTRGSGYYSVPGAEQLVLDDSAHASGMPEGAPRGGQLQKGEAALDSKGSVRTLVPLTFPKQSGPELVTVESEIEDVSRQTGAARASVIVHPGEFYVALSAPSDYFQKVGVPFKPQVVTVEPSGKRRSWVPVHLELIKRSWHTVVEASGEDETHYESRPVDKVLGRCDATSGPGGTATCDLPVTEAGYFIVRATGEDGRKNALASSIGFYATGDASDFAWARSDASTLELVADKKSYEIGDVARILVKSPFRDAEAWVTVERTGIYRQERMRLSGSMPTVEVKITDDYRPNVYVSVALVRGRTRPAPDKGQDVGAPAYSIGYTTLEINRESRRLKVAVTPSKKDFRPGEEVDVDLAVTDRSGKPARADVAFYAVDEGVLLLTGYKTPDPIPTFSASRPLAVVNMESREDLAKLIRVGKGVAGDKGDEGGGGGSARQDFRSTAHFAPSIVTGADGKAHARFKLPDSLTTYRLMAVAASEDDRFGFGESQVTTSRPLMARPALPRFFRSGDRAEAGVIVSTKGLAAGSFEVVLEATGIKVSGDPKRAVDVPASGSVEVRWPLEAPTAGAARLAFHARGLGQKDDVIVSRDVLVPAAPEAVALYGETQQSVAERLGDLQSARADVGGLDLRLASTALVGLDDGVEALLQYPHGCTEQLTSRMVPLVALFDLATDYGIALPKNPNGIIDAAIGKILQNQRDDGGFGYWPDSGRSDPWATAYALFGLHSAKVRGRFVPAEALASATRYLRAELARKDKSAQHLATSAFVLDVLATVGSPDAGYMTKLFEQRKALPLFARALLAHALVKTSPKDAQELLQDVEGSLRITPAGATVVENLGDEYAPLLDSEARTTAMVLRALVAVDPKHPLASRIAKGLLAARKGGAWRSTQENAWALLGLDAYRKAQEADAPSFDVDVFMGEQRIFEADFEGRSVKARTASFAMPKLVASGALGQNLAFQVQGTGKLFYEARIRYARRELPREGLDRGFFVRKYVRALRPEGLADALRTLPQTSAAQAQGGDLVLVDLLVVTPDPREQVIIDDPLPAGLEAVQAKLATTSSDLSVSDPGDRGGDDDSDSEDERANGRGYGYAPYHREMHDDKVLTFVEHMAAGIYHYRYLARATTFGTFVVPPTRAECMYEPETFGRTGSQVFEVRGRK